MGDARSRLGPEFGAWVDARQRALLRTAYLLTGDAATAQRLVVSALGHLVATGASSDPEALEDLATAAMLADVRATWPGASAGPGRPEGETAGGGTDAELTWRFLAGLTPRQRTVVVLQHHPDAPGLDVGLLTGLSRAALRTELEAALASSPFTTDGTARLRSGLEACAEPAPMGPVPLEDVEHQADRLRRARRRRSGLVVGAVLAVLAVTTVVLQVVVPALSGPSASSGPPSPGDPYPDKIGSPTPGPGFARLMAVPSGPPATIAWVRGRTAWTPEDGGRALALAPRAETGTIAPYRSGVLVTEFNDRAFGIYLNYFDAGGARAWRRRADASMAVDLPTGRVAYTLQGRSDTYVLTLADGMGSGTPDRTQSFPSWVSAVGIIGGEVVFTRPERRQVFITDLTSSPRRVPSLLAGLTTCRTGLVGGATKQAGAVVDLASDTVLWTARAWLPRAFSPDCGSVLAEGTSGGWAVLDARTGEIAWTLRTPSGVRLTAGTWEDGDHLLMVALAADAEAVLRFQRDSEPTRAVDPMPAPPGIGLETR